MTSVLPTPWISNVKSNLCVLHMNQAWGLGTSAFSYVRELSTREERGKVGLGAQNFCSFLPSWATNQLALSHLRELPTSEERGRVGLGTQNFCFFLLSWATNQRGEGKGGAKDSELLLFPTFVSFQFARRGEGWGQGLRTLLSPTFVRDK